MIYVGPFGPTATRLLGKKHGFMLGCAIAIVEGILFGLSNSLWLALLALFLVGFGMALLNTMTWALEADTVEYGEYKTGIRTEGATYAAFSFTRKVGQAVGAAIASYALAYIGYQASPHGQPRVAQTDAVVSGMKWATAILPTAFFIIALLIMATYPLTEARFREIMRSIAANGGPTSPAAVVTIAARYGAGGTYVGPRVAERLGVPFLDRVIDKSVTERTGLPEGQIAGYEERARGGVSRLLGNLSKVAPLDGPPVEVWDTDERRVQVELQEFMGEATQHGGVILGRGGNFVLRDVVPTVLCVLLTGPRDARVAQAMRLLGLDRETAERNLEVNDKARLDYVRRNYGAAREDHNDYHVVIDTTVVDLDTVVDTIVDLSASRCRHREG